MNSWYRVYIYYAAGCKGYVCDIITCVCTVDNVPVEITVNREIFNGNKFSRLAESMKN